MRALKEGGVGWEERKFQLAVFVDVNDLGEETYLERDDEVINHFTLKVMLAGLGGGWSRGCGL